MTRSSCAQVLLLVGASKDLKPYDKHQPCLRRIQIFQRQLAPAFCRMAPIVTKAGHVPERCECSQCLVVERGRLVGEVTTRQSYQALNATCHPVISCHLGFLLHVVANAKVCYEVDGSLQQISVNPEKSSRCCQAAANQKLLT